VVGHEEREVALHGGGVASLLMACKVEGVLVLVVDVVACDMFVMASVSHLPSRDAAPVVFSSITVSASTCPITC